MSLPQLSISLSLLSILLATPIALLALYGLIRSEVQGPSYGFSSLQLMGLPPDGNLDGMVSLPGQNRRYF